jgi:hypothetical protein
MDIREKRIIEEVEALSEDMLDFACRLNAQPSTLGEEAPVPRTMWRPARRMSGPSTSSDTARPRALGQ